MKRRHRRPRVAVEGVVERLPGPAPDLLADVDHQPAHAASSAATSAGRARPALDVALLGRPPRRRRRDGEVERAAEVVGGGHLARGAGEAGRVAAPGRRAAPRAARRTRPSGRPRARGRARVTSPGRLSARCRRTFGSSPSAEHAVGDDRVADPQPPAQRLGIVVGKLVGHRERPHLQREEDGVAARRARAEHRDRERAGGDRGRVTGAGIAAPAADERHGDRGGERRAAAPRARTAARRRGRDAALGARAVARRASIGRGSGAAASPRGSRSRPPSAIRMRPP